jgi:hypothetical protein
MNTFYDDLEKGKKVEEQVCLLLRKTYPSASIIHAYKGYDIWIPELGQGVEVKYDPMSNKTGNIVVEYEMFNKPSAIMTTTAFSWVFYDDSVFVSIRPMQIIKCIFDLKLEYREFVGKGDSVSKKAFLVPKDKLFSYGKILVCE